MRDVALIGGINFDGDANVVKWLPGERLSWEVPGFIFLNTDFIDASSGIEQGGAPRTTNSFMLDVSSGAVDLESQSFWFTAAAYCGRHAGRSRTTSRRW